MLCQHCGNAPCEPVCPVYATYHAPDGLNVQVYNRCVGTRYCSNNCPYKVRYFNWFGYGEPNRPQYAFPEPLNWQLNPDVTVRGKGVMEKCTFCVQRIREAENRARAEKRASSSRTSSRSACAQACPSRAIMFGDAADRTLGRRSSGRTTTRAYHVFEELNTFTAVVYLKKVNHPAQAARSGRGSRRRVGLATMATVTRPHRGRCRAPEHRRRRTSSCRPSQTTSRSTDEIIRTLHADAVRGSSGSAIGDLVPAHRHRHAGSTRSTAGLGVAGYNPPVMWGVYIITFVFWVGIGHAGTLISAILYLFRAGFRTTIYRCAEAMTVFAVMTAGTLPDSAPRAAVEVLLADSVSELALHLAELQEPAGVGRLRDSHVPHGLDARSCTSA